MSKQLNLELFGETPAIGFEEPAVAEQVYENYHSLKMLSDELTNVKMKQEESIFETQHKMERLQVSLARLEQIHNHFVQDLSEKFQLLIKKQVDQNKFEEKIQNLMDRHQTLMSSYELRMQQLQKILSQKEVEILELKGYISELRHHKVSHGPLLQDR